MPYVSSHIWIELQIIFHQPGFQQTRITVHIPFLHCVYLPFVCFWVSFQKNFGCEFWVVPTRDCMHVFIHVVVSCAKYMIFINGPMKRRKHQVARFFCFGHEWHQVSLLALRGQESDLVGCAGGVLVCWFLA